MGDVVDYLSTTEGQRLQFIIDRDGIEAADEFAKRTLAKYRECLNQKRKVLNARGELSRAAHFASLPEYRSKFIKSCLMFRRYLLHRRKYFA